MSILSCNSVAVTSCTFKKFYVLFLGPKQWDDIFFSYRYRLIHVYALCFYSFLGFYIVAVAVVIIVIIIILGTWQWEREFSFFPFPAQYFLYI